MINKDVVVKIKEELLTTDNSISEIAHRYNVSKATVNNINIGKSHRENTLYPIRQAVLRFTDNEVAFVRKLSNEGYSAKQIHIILCKGAYSTIANLISRKTRPEEIVYKIDKGLENRKDIFDLISTPQPSFINSYTDQVTIEDARYIKFLGRFMAPLLPTVEIFIPIIESDMVGFDYPIESIEDLAKYIEWGGTAFGSIWWIKNIYHNKVNRLNNQPIYYNDFPIELFTTLNPHVDLSIIKEMMNFDTKENYKKAS